MANNGFEGFDIVAWIAVHFDISNVASVTECVIWRLDVNLVESGNWVIDRHVEGVGIEITVGNTFDLAVFLAIHASEATRKPFGWSGKKREVKVMTFGSFVAEFAHVADDVKAEFLRFGGFAMMFASHCNKRLSEADEAN